MKRTIRSVSNVIMGQSPPGSTYNAEGEGLLLLNGPTEFGPTYPHCTLFTTDSRRECEPYDLIFCVRGSTTGRMNWADRKYSLGRGVCAIHAESNIETCFIRYCIENHLSELLKLAGGGTFPNLTKNDIENFEIPWPENRRSIAGILLAYDDLIENNLRRIKILEEMARSLYCEWFVNFRFPGHEKVQMVDSPLGKIPKGWEGHFDDLATMDRKGINPFEFPNEEFEHFSIPAFDNFQLPSVELGESILSGKYLIDRDCVLISKLNPRIPRIWYAMPTGKYRALTSTEFISLKPKSKVTKEFLFAKCFSEDFTCHFCSLAIGTSTSHQRVKPDNLMDMSTTVPGAEYIDRFSNILRPILDKIPKLRIKNSNLRCTRDLLLPKLISGELDVSKLDIANAGDSA
ncbi:MAG: restriction endonuclease subunit S [Candidatus Pacebacteria bacterium]|nr:restriction endonuclease subunit S [Candidatus Paceibacterota bacterium]MDD5222394.1 restriction endonuclease subunit S [bacterium]